VKYLDFFRGSSDKRIARQFIEALRAAVERDLYFRADKPLSAYAEEARERRRIVAWIFETGRRPEGRRLLATSGRGICRLESELARQIRRRVTQCIGASGKQFSASPESP
jgi:hypothetical protein